jgi:hypothetical protein
MAIKKSTEKIAGQPLTADTLAKYLYAIKKVRTKKSLFPYLFRGHSKSEWSLVPSLGRSKVKKGFIFNWESFERKIIQKLKRQAPPHLKYPPQNDLQWISLAQHHGVPTRLLDWSTSPLVALYFCVENDTDKDGSVWCFGPSMAYISDHDLINNLKIQKIGRVEPFHLTPRISNQQSCFTIHPLPSGKEKFESVRDEGESKGLVRSRLFEIKILSWHKDKIRSELNDVGVNRYSLFPDLDGLCSHLKWETAK